MVYYFSVMEILAPSSPPSPQAVLSAALLKSRIVKRKRERTALEETLTEERLAWLARYAKNRYDAYYSALSTWRNDLDCYLQQSEDYFEWRRSAANRNSGPHSIFSRQNDSLNLVGAFSEFFTAHAQNDLFGSSPWFTTKPQGRADKALADHIAAHAAWKLRPTGLTEAYREAVSLASVLGTCFTKKTWETHTDYHPEDAAAERDDDDANQNAATRADDGAGEDEDVVYANVKAYNLHYRDVAFDRTAPELDLRYTDFFHVFERPLLDVIAEYHLDELGAYRLYTSASDSQRSQAVMGESYRGETAAPTVADGESLPGMMPNIPVKLCEGYLRLDVLGRGKPSRLYVVFCPELEIILRADYLANVTPNGDLPVHAHTIYKPAWRITGRGFFEKYASTQTFVDDLFNRINYHDRKSSNPITGMDRSLMEAEEEDAEAQPFDPDKPVNLKPGGKLEEAIQFKVLPDLSSRTISQLQMAIQMTQLRTGITAASQGEMSSLPETSTATGINQLMSRAAVLMKAPIDALKSSFTADINYTVKLLYANQDRDETFLYGEGENMELAQLRAADVRDLEIHVELLLSQAQSQTKLENARAAMQIHAQYVALPEIEKGPARSLYLQALRSLDFADADSILRPPVVNAQEAVALLPQDQQAALMRQLQLAQQAPAGTPSPMALPHSARPSPQS